MKKLFVFGLILGVVFLIGCTTNVPVACTEDARMCPDGSAVVRIPPDCEFEPCPEVKGMTYEGAVAIAQASECVEKGDLTDQYMYNENSKTWWIDLDIRPGFDKDYCYPACVVFQEEERAEINWRCTGAIPN